MVLKRKLPSKTGDIKPADGTSTAQGKPPSPQDEVRMSAQGGADFEASLEPARATDAPVVEQKATEADRPRKTIDLDDILGTAPAKPAKAALDAPSMEVDDLPPKRPTPAPSLDDTIKPSTPKPSMGTPAFEAPIAAPPKRTQASAGIVPPLSMADEIDGLDTELTPAVQKPVAPPSYIPTADEMDMGPAKANDGSWDLEELVEVKGPANSSSADAASPVTGVYGAAPKVDTPYTSPKVDSPKQPPWKHSAGADAPKREAPILPNKPVKGVKPGSASSSGMVGTITSLAVIGGITFGAYYAFTNLDHVQEMVARWTGALNQVSQDLPVEPPPVAINRDVSTAVIADAGTIELTRRGGDNGGAGGGDEPPLPPVTEKAQGSGAMVEFADVTPEEARKPIAADGSEEIPDDVNAFAKLMDKISEKRKEKRQTDAAKLPDEPADLDPADLNPVERTLRNNEVISSVEEELAAYRKALSQTDNPALKPRPGEFFSGQGRPQVPQTARPNEQSRNNPVMAEPTADVAPKKPEVRSMADFNVDMFDPTGERVRLPRGLRPRLSAADFPSLELLSLVPNYGLIAVSKGREGVLLVGDTFEGWELVAVRDGYAEFRFGDRKYVLSMSHADR